MKVKTITSAVLLFSMATLLACTSPATEPTYYLMRGEPSEGADRIDASMRFGLGRVSVAPYLLVDAGIVVETAPGQVRAARQHQWIEPVDAGLRWFLRGEISRALGFQAGGGLLDRSEWDYSIDVYVGRMHGTLEGTALLEALYVIRPVDRSSQAVMEYRFSKSMPLDDDGYEALVRAEMGLVKELANSIAAALRELPTS